MQELPFRQIHLDFHTSEIIPGVGDKFNSSEFIGTLKDANVNSINLFAKCHHGMYYYPTKIGTMHPSLKFDLFGEQIKACREAGIRAIAYTCVSWNEEWARRHPEWLQIDSDGVLGLRPPFRDRYYNWYNLCINNKAHQEYILEEIQEIYDMYKPDGYWVDICVSRECVCPTCRDEMIKLGMNPANKEDVIKHDRMNETGFVSMIYSFVKNLDSNLGVYCNSHPYEMDLNDDLDLSCKKKRTFYSYIDIESLPSGAWGYTHFPIVANYLNKYDQELTMMNGKFLTAWGDFNSLRNDAAMEYECFRAIANGAKVCVGDQMHPSGKLDDATYKLIGRVFDKILKKEPWLTSSIKVSNVGVFPISKACKASALYSNPTEEGVYRILTESHIPFDFIDYNDDFSKYDLIIIPDNVPLTSPVAARIDGFVENGGKLLVTNKSSLDNEGNFLVKSLPVKYIGDSNYIVRYARFSNDVFSDIPKTDHVLYQKGVTVEALGDAVILANIVPPYFNRDYLNFCSHRQTPPVLEASDEPCIISNGSVIYINSPLFEDYCINGYKIHKDLISKCIDLLVKNPVIKANLPSLTEVTVRDIPSARIIHFLSYSITKKCKNMDLIEDAIFVPDTAIKVKIDFIPSKVMLVPEKSEISFDYIDGYVYFIIDKMKGHQMVAICR